MFVIFFMKLKKVTIFKLCFISVSENSVLEAEVRSLQRQLAKRDNEILKQDRELHKLRSVLQQASSLLPSDKVRQSTVPL